MAMTVEKLKDGTFEFQGRAFKTTEAKNKLLEPFGKQIHNYGLVLCLEPSPEQKSMINQQIGNARVVRNDYLHTRQEYYAETKKTLSGSEYKKTYLPKLKEEKDFLLLSDKFALENAIIHVEDAYKNFFEKRAGFPKYASKRKPSGSRYTTNQTNNNIDLLMDDGKPCIKLPKVGRVRIVVPKGETLNSLRPSGTVIQHATISMFSDGTYEVSLLMQTVIDKIVPVTKVRARDVFSIDLGLHDFGIVGDGVEYEKIANPRWIRLHEKRLRRFQKALSRKKYDKKTHTGSKNWEKARLRVAKEQKKTANQRKDFHNKLSTIIADNCSAFICEDLNIKGMIKNRHLSKAIASVGWGSFLIKLQYKLERMGKPFVKVDRWFPSSQTCSHCGYVNKETKDLAVREWACPKCGTHHDRDGNAAMNIHAEGLRVLQKNGITVTA